MNALRQMVGAAAPATAPATPRTTAAASRRLVVVSNRVAIERKSSAGGLANAILDALGRSGGIWFGWSGGIAEDPPAAPTMRSSGSVTFATLDLAKADYDEYYSGFANRVLWPLFHFRPSLVEYRRREAEGYARVNRLFASHLAPLLRERDLVWIHDYHFIPLAEELRRLGARQPLGFFLHIPFPPPELLRIVPNHRDLVRQLCAYDLVGFQTDSDRDAFRDHLLREAGGRDLGDGRIAAFDRIVAAAAIPIGIDVAKMAALAEEAVQSKQTRRLCESLRDRALIIGVDRLDYTKGLLARFEAFQQLIERFPETRGHVTFMQIAPPSRSDVPEYMEIRRSLEALSGHVNGRFSEFDWTPVRYLNKSLAQRTLAGFFRVARIGLVTPLRDGMNLVAKEYVASQNPVDPGALVLSCFAGAAHELRDALIVNPYDVEGLAETLKAALEMPAGERRERWEGMMRTLRRNDITAWREGFLDRLAETEAIG